jgi:hypothetical protein
MKLTKCDKSLILREIKYDLPKIDDTEAIQVALEKSMSQLCRKLYKLDPVALRTEYATSYDFLQDGGHEYYVGDADFAAVTKPFKDKKKAREATLNKVSAALDSCTTLKQLQERLPEFVKYFHAEVTKSTNSLVVQSPVNELRAIGWPVGSKK